MVVDAPPALAPPTTRGTRISATVVVRSVYEDVLNEGSLEMVEDLVAAGAVDHAVHERSSLPISSPSALRAFVEMFCFAFPDAHWTVTDIRECGDLVDVHTVVTGTQHGAFLGIRPKGRELVLHSIDRVRIENGKIVEHWGELDVDTMVTHLDGEGAARESYGTHSARGAASRTF